MSETIFKNGSEKQPIIYTVVCGRIKYRIQPERTRQKMTVTTGIIHMFVSIAAKFMFPKNEAQKGAVPRNADTDKAILPVIADGINSFSKILCKIS